MRFSPALALLVCAAMGWGQAPDDAAVAVARAELAHIRSLVDAGALPRASVDQARSALADAQDAVVLRRIAAAGSDLNVEQADELVATEKRRVDRRQKAYDDVAELVRAGIAPQVSLLPPEEDLAHEKREEVLAEERAGLIHELAEMAAAEATELAPANSPDSTFLSSSYNKVEQAYRLRFGKPMPVSAMGETAVHRAMGFDHRGRVDVALNPDQREGVWLTAYLKQNHIPFLVFYGPVPGKATGAHIHIGPPSTRYVPGG